MEDFALNGSHDAAPGGGLEMIANKRVRERLARVIERVLEAELMRQQTVGSQEPQITGGLAAELRHGGVRLSNGWDLEITAQDLPDRGEGSVEDICGADMYVAITVRVPGQPPISKGFLVQAKVGPAGRSKDLVTQCGKMKAKTEAAYVWIYDEEGKLVVRSAEDVLSRTPRSRRPWPDRGISDLVASVLECREGDQGFGIPPTSTTTEGLARRIRELKVPLAVAFEATPHPG